MQDKAMVAVEIVNVKDLFHPSLSPAYPPISTLVKPIRGLRPRITLAKPASNPLLSVRYVVRYVEMVPPAAFLKSMRKRKEMKVTVKTSLKGVARPFFSC